VARERTKWHPRGKSWVGGKKGSILKENVFFQGAMSGRGKLGRESKEKGASLREALS